MASRSAERGQRGAAGGIERSPEVERAAILIGLGLDGWGLIESSDPDREILATLLAERVADHRRREREQLAVEIVNALSKAMKK